MPLSLGHSQRGHGLPSELRGAEGTGPYTRRQCHCLWDKCGRPIGSQGGEYKQAAKVDSVVLLMPTQTNTSSIIVRRMNALAPHLLHTFRHPLSSATLDLNQDLTKPIVLGQTGPVISLNGAAQPGGMEVVPWSRSSSSVATDSGVVGGVAGENTSVSQAPSIRVKPSTSHDLARQTSMARRSSLPSVSHTRQPTMSSQSTLPILHSG